MYGIQRYEARVGPTPCPDASHCDPQPPQDVLDAVDTTPEMLQALPMPVVFVGAANDARRPGFALLERRGKRIKRHVFG